MSQSNASYSTPSQPANGSSKTKGVISLVLGIVGLLLAVPLSIIGAIIGIPAVILGILSRRSEPAARGLALGGLITGILAIVIGAILFIVGLIALSSGLVTVPSS